MQPHTRAPRILLVPALLLLWAASAAAEDGDAGRAPTLAAADDHAASLTFFEKKGNLREAVYHGRRAVDLYLVCGRGKTAGRLLQRVATLLKAQGMRDAAVKAARRASALQREVGDDVGLALSLCSLGLLKAAGPEPGEGLPDFLAGLDLALDRGLRGARRLILEEAGSMVKLLGGEGTAGAQGFLRDLAGRCGDAGLYAAAEAYLRRAYTGALRAGSPGGALEASDRLLALSRRRGYAFGEAEAHKSRGLALLEGGEEDRAGRWERAQEAFETEEALRRDLDDTVGLAWCLNNLGYVLFLRGRCADAEPRLRKAFDLFVELGLGDGASKAACNLADLAAKTGDAGAARRAKKAGERARGLGRPAPREFTFEPSDKRLAYYMFLRVGDEDPVVEIRAEADRLLFRDVATGETFAPVPVHASPARVTVSAPGLMKWFEKEPRQVAKSVFFVLGRRYVKYGDSLLFLRPGERVYSVRDNRLLRVRGRDVSLDGRDVTGRWEPTGAYPDRSTPQDALATLVEAINRGVVKAGAPGRPAVVDEEAYAVFLETLTPFIRREIDRDSFVGTSEKRKALALGVSVEEVRELRDGWVRLRYRYVSRDPDGDAAAEEARAVMERQGLLGDYVAFALRRGGAWQVDFLAGRN